MDEIQTCAFELRPLRGSFKADFDEWDLAASRGDTAAIRKVRRSILSNARRQLSGPVTELPGFYVFTEVNQADMRSILYIGIAESVRRPLAQRIVDRLRDDSALDTRLDELDDNDARTTVLHRLTVALPGSGQNYLEDHLRTAKLLRRCSHVLIAGVNADRDLIRATERVLVGSASKAGAKLVNRHYAEFRGACLPEARRLARRVLGALAPQLPEDAVRSWSAAINTLA